ncbi:sensor histidine kinase [Chitinophaga sancti]|uniref:histidine kinase n=1 Tax=Chitinophaga sancti TaxID=1004 RepID=A0A1K1LSB9_9BACT|nr:HAMP domain-containing sensor histidine kinase [Chitinophaga sancti]WQD64885.1 HAMP domain-containing sensor histidine kinase [Chitinophaga sancti]WQG89491.1 HAMP domain-containing sensor histidine kinase [Chitinophaga sancti]SFW13772.1 HAMP domain-containing protein [Chitinophaga sancti]
MLDIKEIRLFFIRHGYLLIVAAWLFTFSFLFSNYWSYYSSPMGVKRSLEKSISQRETSFERIIKDQFLLNHLFSRNYNEKEIKSLDTKDFYVFAYDSSEAGRWLVFWSTNMVMPEEWQVPLVDGNHFVKLKNGYYEVLCRRVLSPEAGHERFMVGVIPIMMEYSFSNNYLVNHFYDKPALGREYSINVKAPGIPVLNGQNLILFYLNYDRTMDTKPPNLLSVILRVMGCICVLIFINLFAATVARQKSALNGFLLLAAVVIIFRLLSYLYPFPFNLRTLNIFTPLIYAKDEIFRSLGDLLLNVSLTFWLLLFFRQHVKSIKAPPVKNVWQQRLVIILSSYVMYVVGQFLSDLIQSLVIDSRISFDVANPFSLNEYSIIGAIILGFIAFSFLFFSQIVNSLLNELTSFRHRTKYVFLAMVGVVWVVFRIHNPEIYYSIALVIWLIIYVILLDVLAVKFENSLATVPFLFWLFLLTITTSAVLVYYNDQKELSQRERMARELSKQKDPYLEMLLRDVTKQMEQDELLQYFFQQNNGGNMPKSTLENELKQKYFKGYLGRFKVDIYAFDENGMPIYGGDTSSFYSLSRKMIVESELIGNDLYYNTRGFNDYSYIGQKDFYRNGEKAGYLVYELTPVVINSQRLYPELLVSGDIYDPEKESNAAYSYAIYDKGQLVNNNNDYAFPVKLYDSDVPNEEVTLRKVGGYSLMYYKASKEKVVIVAKEIRSFIEFITLFAYMFCLFLLIIAIYRALDLLVKARMRISNLRSLVNFNIRRKVTGTIIFIVVFAFVILGLTTVLFFIDRSERENKERLSHTINEVTHDVEKVFANQRMFDDLEDLYDPIFQSSLSESIGEIADERALDINIYDRDGNLQVTTQPLITEKGLLSRKINPDAYMQLGRQQKIQWIQKEKIGSMGYLSGYAPLRNNGEIFAYLNVPYFATQTELNQQISNFLVALINFNAFIFLIAGLLALFITNSITKSFSLVTERLRHVSLGQQNDEIEWEKDDEIGALVKEYNKMVRKLEVSAARLAKSEREGAWREMARQVAHEIKNPLTPMKLSIQYLQRAIDNDAPNVKQLSHNVARTLVEQIEHLANIASDFSTFARIGEANSEVLMLNEVLHSLKELYQSHEHSQIVFNHPGHAFYVFADKTQMNRLFTNLLQNAIQAIPEDREGLITINMEELDPGWVTVSVTDNGDGIPPEIQSKIFVPNFTTKNSGTGLGLAMCKNIVEQARGEIWFETQLTVGTSFYVKLPIEANKQ